MSFVLTSLIFFNVLIAVWYAARKCWSPRGVEFNHVMAFSCGFLFYWILPVALGIWRFFEGMPGMSFWYGLFDGIDDSKLARYLLISLVAYIFFAVGTERGERSPLKSPERGKKQFLNTRLMNGYLMLAGVFFLAAGLAIRGEFFKGYSNIDNVDDLNSRNIFSAVMVFSISLWILYASMRHQTLNKSEATFAIFKNKFLALCLVEAILSISMGSRYIVLSSAFMIATYCTVYLKKWRPLAMGGFLSMLLAFALAIGAFRGGFNVTQSFGDVAFRGLDETLYGALSLTYFLKEYSFGVLRWPVYLLSDYIYLVPRILLPMKDALILSPEGGGFHIENPVGGVNSFFSFMVNFGALGTMLFLYYFSYGLGFLKSRRDSILARTTYSMISGWVLISFFRNSFEISLTKDIFEMSIIVPAFVLASIYMFSSPVRARQPKAAKSNSLPPAGFAPPTSNTSSESDAGVK